ncbi:MAG TPA: hypothetical protein VF331_09830 [Polyangiales bacterium]
MSQQAPIETPQATGLAPRRGVPPALARAEPAVVAHPARPTTRATGHASPAAFGWALGLAMLTSAVAWLSAIALLDSGPRTVLVLGDSVFANYRLERGGRVQDWLSRELGRGWSTVNLSEPAAHTGDLYLQLAKAEFLRVQPSVVVIGLSPQKLLNEPDEDPRLDEDGTNLRWLPFDREGYELFKTLDPHLQRVSVVRKLGLFTVGFYEALRSVWLEHVEWPWERRRRAHESPARRQAWMRGHARQIARRWEAETRTQSYERFTATTEAHDFRFLVDALRRRGVPMLVVMTPEMHTGILHTLSPRVLERMHQAYHYSLTYCAQLQVPVVDFNSQRERERFGPEQWDDIYHLRAAESFRRMAHEIYRWMGAQGLTPGTANALALAADRQPRSHGATQRP